MTKSLRHWLLILGTVSASQSVFEYSQSVSVSVDIVPYFNNKGTSLGGENDGVGFNCGSTFPAEFLPKGSWLDSGVEFSLPHNWDALEFDNIRADSQVITLPKSAEVTSLHLVVAGEDPGGFLKGESKERIILLFNDGSSDVAHFDVKNWWAIHWTNKSPIRAPFHYAGDGSRNYNATHLFHLPLALPYTSSGRELVSIQLPQANSWNTLHIFALSYIPTTTVTISNPLPDEHKLVTRKVRSTRRWSTVGERRGQVLEVTIANPLSVSLHGNPRSWISSTLRVSLSGSTFSTLQSADVSRMMPGDEITVEILIAPTSDSILFSDPTITFDIHGKHWSIPVLIEGSDLVHNWSDWTETTEDLEQHSSPSWFDGAKFGIFIHWGIYSVPGWTDAHKYAEWYNWWLHDEGQAGGTYKHHLEAFGANFTYDDFIPHFTGARFNASAWIDLFAEAGAKYFVLTTKHHDGFALFDTGATSDRNSVKLGPKRDFLRELMDAATTERPELKRGTYFSMPEWFNPLYHQYGKHTFVRLLPGGLALNPYKPDTYETYTGFKIIADFIEDIQLPQMRILANDYKTDLMWCDIGLANHSSIFAAEWFSSTSQEGRQIAMDNRCGVGGDFDSPEMTKFSTVQARKWETCAGMDPYSFGYNAGTKPNEYRNATDIIHSLVDIVSGRNLFLANLHRNGVLILDVESQTSKGGNFLLNVGPTGEGEIIDAMSLPLLEAGRWLKVNGRSIYDTIPFNLLPEFRTENIDVRFTRTASAFYIISLKPLQTEGLFSITAPLPILPCDLIFLIRPKRDLLVPWKYLNGTLELELPSTPGEDEVGQIGIVFEVKYNSCVEEERYRDEL